MMKLTADAIKQAWNDSACPPDIFVLDSIDSTNAEAKRMLLQGARTPFLLVANEQTAGRGRLGRSFYSPADTGVYMTLALRSDASEPADPLRLTSAAAVAVVLAIETLTSQRPQIKWVNDVYLDGRKICGILAEAITDMAACRISHILIGIGVNVSTTAFPAMLSGTAASLCAPELSRASLISAIAERLLHWSARLDPRDYMPFYRSHSLVLGQWIRYSRAGGDFVQAKALAIDDEGGLVVLHEDSSTATLRTGEITLRLCANPPQYSS